MTSWKPEVKVDGKWYGNGLTFATEAEAADWARDLAGRWTLAIDHRAAVSTEPVTHRLEGRKAIPIEPTAAA